MQLSEIVIVLMAILADAAGGLEKPYSLTVLEMTASRAIPGQPSHHGEACKAASQFVVDIVNKRRDILPSYKIELQFEDEVSGTAPPRIVNTFTESFNKKTGLRNGAYRSPLMIGPFNSIGCAAMGTFLQHIGTVAISTYCSAQTLTNHVAYPNLYLMGNPNNLGDFFVRIAKTLAGARQAAIISNAAGPNDVASAQQIHRSAMANGLKITWFNVLLDMSDGTIQSLKDSDARIIFVYLTLTDPIVQFFCRAYLSGIAGPKYLFILNGGVFISPAVLPEVLFRQPFLCTREMIVDQMEHSLYAFPTNLDDQIGFVSLLGYNQTWFDTMLDRNYLNYTRPADYVTRTVCHDAVLRSIVSLDDTEKILQTRNLSLRDAYLYPDLVMKVTNESVLNSHLSGIVISDMAYDAHGIHSNDVLSVFSFSRRRGMETLFVTDQPSSRNGSLAFNSYNFKPIRGFFWQAWNGKPPLDRAIVTVVTEDVSLSVFSVIVGAASLLATSQVFALSFTAYFYKVKTSNSPFPYSKLAGLLGCVVLDGAAVSFTARSTEAPLVAWSLRIVLLSVSLATIVPLLALKATSISWANSVIIRPNIGMSFTTTETNEAFKRTLRELERSRVRFILIRSELLTLIKTTVYLGINVIILLVWLLQDPLQCRGQVLPLKRILHDGREVFSFEKQSSAYSGFCLITFYLIHLPALFIALLTVIAFRKKRLPGMKYIGAGIINAITMIVACVLIVVILQSSQVHQRIAVASLALVLSASTTVFWMVPVVKAFVRYHKRH